MKIFKSLLHVWITLISVLTFLGGWIMLAHSKKPVQPTSSAASSVSLAPMPTLPPIQAYNGSSSSSVPSIGQVQPVQQQSFLPMMRTGGS